MDKLEDLLRALLKNGLKISPKKCQLFRTKFTIHRIMKYLYKTKEYMCTTFKKQVGMLYKNYNPPSTVKSCRSFAGDGKLFEYV